MSETELKPCPCGGKAVHVKLFDHKRYDCFFRCDKCGYETKTYVSKQGAKNAWNRRADHMSKEKQIEELEEMINRGCLGQKCEGCKCHGIRNCQAYYRAKLILEAGYSKQIEGAWIFHKDGSATCDQCHRTQKNVYDDDHHQAYCGVCGARMKGE